MRQYSEGKTQIGELGDMPFLSALLIAVMIVSTGCTALMIGDNRKAYNLMVKAAEYFKVPASVQIISGEMSGDSLYCVIRARNSYGYCQQWI